MEIVHDALDLTRYMREAVKVSNDSPVLLDRFLNDAIEVDVDAVCDGRDVVIGGVLADIGGRGGASGLLGVLAPAVFAVAGVAAGARAPDRRHGSCPEGGGTDERPVRY